MGSQKGSIDTYQRNGSCSDVWQPCPPLSSKVSGPMLVGGLFHRGLDHQPPPSVLGDITPYQCLFGSPPDYSSIRLFFLLCSYTCPATSEACILCKHMFLKGAQKGFRCFDPSSRSRRPGMLPSMSTSSYTPLVGAYWISIFWIFFTGGFSCASRA